MKNIVLCFDQSRRQHRTGETTNATEIHRMLEQSDRQVVWNHSLRTRRLRHRDGFTDIRCAVSSAYSFLAKTWRPGDRIFMFGVGCGAYSAQALTRFIGTFGFVAPDRQHLADYALTAYALPRTPRTSNEWDRVKQLAADLKASDSNHEGGDEISIPVAFLGLWDAVRPHSLPNPPSGEPWANVAAGRHAVAVDGGPFGERLVSVQSDAVEEAWFRGAHCDVAGGPGACEPLASITLDWVLNGAIAAGALTRTDVSFTAPTPSRSDALAGSARNMSFRKLPDDAHVHASIDVYLRMHAKYWRRLPARIVWTDQDWLARGERLVGPTGTARARFDKLAAVAS